MRLDFIDPAAVKITIDGFNVLTYTNMETGEVFPNVTIKLMFPLTQSAYFVGIYQEGKEVALIEDYRKLDAKTRDLVYKIIEKQYFIPEIKRVLSIKEEYRIIHWCVVTNRGYQEFYTRTRNDVVVKGHEVYIRDIDGNRYIIKDFTKLDPTSQKVLSPEI